jgi:hypothetical protein
VFLVLVAEAPAPVWKVARSAKTDAIVDTLIASAIAATISD